MNIGIGRRGWFCVSLSLASYHWRWIAFSCFHIFFTGGYVNGNYGGMVMGKSDEMMEAWRMSIVACRERCIVRMSELLGKQRFLYNN